MTEGPHPTPAAPPVPPVVEAVPRGGAVAVFAAGALLVFAGITTLLLCLAVQQAGQLVRSVPQLLDQASVQAERFGIRFDDPQVQQRLRSALERAPALLASSIGAIYGVLGGVSARCSRR